MSQNSKGRNYSDYVLLLEHPNVQAFMDVVAFTEGTDSIALRNLTTGYYVANGRNEIIKSLVTKPRNKFPTGTTSAMGRYQILNSTWDEFTKWLGSTSFSEHHQDIFLIWKLDRRKALDDLLNGNLETVIQKTAPEWASFPVVFPIRGKTVGKSYYGQPSRTLDEIKNVYTASGGSFFLSNNRQPANLTGQGGFQSFFYWLFGSFSK